MTVPTALLSHASTEHYTPQFILDAVIACMGAIDLDPASNSTEIPNVPAAKHYTIRDNGLVQPWEGRVFLNPPFGPGVEVWFSKLYQERLAGRTTEAIVLWKSATETAAWKTLTALSCRVCFLSARIHFIRPMGNESGSTFSPALFYVGVGPKRFEMAFDEIGQVWMVPGRRYYSRQEQR
ncbi:MAG: DNA N-6-adenine-methyltransferase (Dam) [Methanoregula sp. PtaU1.Bin051]|nr:MAG: DNA N-6-adenine-methyltransferase (Dam) [Methanoregula sp. PtaU1.Bin051]